MAEAPKYNFNNSKFGGGFAAESGTQIGSTLNDFSQNIDRNRTEISHLLNSLRTMTQAFPEEKREEAMVHLEDLETDIQQPETRKPNRVKVRLAALLAIAVGIGGGVATATDFTNNVLELSGKLGVRIPFSQQPSKQQIDSSTRSQQVNLAAQGIDRQQAEILRANLTTFADDWNSPEMSIYDDYDAAKAALEAR